MQVFNFVFICLHRTIHLQALTGLVYLGLLKTGFLALGDLEAQRGSRPCLSKFSSIRSCSAITIFARLQGSFITCNQYCSYAFILWSQINYHGYKYTELFNI